MKAILRNKRYFGLVLDHYGFGLIDVIEHLKKKFSENSRC